jgi:hypothetical protein
VQCRSSNQFTFLLLRAQDPKRFFVDPVDVLPRGHDRTEVKMRVLRISLLLLLSCFAARAQEPRMEVGRGVMCDTFDQVKRFVALRSNGKESNVALLTVNGEAGEARACNFGLVQFSAAEPLANMAINGRPVTIVRITVHAFSNGSAWKQIPETVQYTAVPEQGRMARLDRPAPKLSGHEDT